MKDHDLQAGLVGRLDAERVDATTEEDIARQLASDEAEAMQDAAKLHSLRLLRLPCYLSGYDS